MTRLSTERLGKRGRAPAGHWSSRESAEGLTGAAQYAFKHSRQRLVTWFWAGLTVLLGISCSTRASVEQPPEFVFALTANNEVVVVENKGPSAELKRVISLGPMSPAPREGYYLKFNKEGSYLFALVRTDPGESKLAVIDTHSFKVTHLWPLPPGSNFQSVDVGTRSGSVYLFGSKGSELVITSLDPY